ncbi:M67 family metallopeptidase [Helicobacter sp. 11S03491-1]|uniref:M67 family metallopeptidase n=1 Tax=Helicobacter sp. 11S03491-1 TaxID=1476196 RepID=UPI000BA67D41|nr:M67 family metallopeptidase [Helicobacter sp. 11S03491-1]PAF41875.1 hypothetical protein BKH45_06085 [Helicobacter sp. 11S03491-1]
MIYLNQLLYEELIAYAKFHSPNECCGYLLGKQESDEQNHIKEIFKIQNIHQNSEHFFMLSPQGQLDSLQRAKKQNLEIVGIFHSHPFSKPYPSEEDLKYFYDSRQSYCIITLIPIPKIVSFRIKETKVYEEKIKI